MAGSEPREPLLILMDGDTGSQLDRLFESLAHRRRRHVLVCLYEHHAMTLADLADEVAVKVYDQRLDKIPAETVKQIYLSLYHNHIPKLESANMVRYSQSADSVELGDAIGQAAPFLDEIE